MTRWNAYYFGTLEDTLPAQADESVPVLARELFAAQAEEYAQLQAQIAEVDAKLMAWECSRRLAKIPGVGPVGAALLMMKNSRSRDVSIGGSSQPGSA